MCLPFDSTALEIKLILIEEEDDESLVSFWCSQEAKGDRGHNQADEDRIVTVD